MKIHFRWGTKAREQNQETRNDCDVISGLQAFGKQISSTFSCFLTSNVPLYHFFANLLAHNKKTAAWLAQLVGHQSAVREVEGSSPRPDQHSGS